MKSEASPFVNAINAIQADITLNETSRLYAIRFVRNAWRHGLAHLSRQVYRPRLKHDAAYRAWQIRFFEPYGGDK